jgi:hypothetical protein
MKKNKFVVGEDEADRFIIHKAPKTSVKDVQLAGLANFGGKQSTPFGQKKAAAKAGLQKNNAKSSDGKVRGNFALPGKRAFPLNTPGRVAAAPGMAARSAAAGNITPEQATMIRKAAAKARLKGSK